MIIAEYYGDKNSLEYQQFLDEYLKMVRSERNQMLSECDWVMLSDNSVSDAKRAEFTSYRQQLRDITEPLKNSRAAFAQGVVQSLPPIAWPVKPEL